MKTPPQGFLGVDPHHRPDVTDMAEQHVEEAIGHRTQTLAFTDGRRGQNHPRDAEEPFRPLLGRKLRRQRLDPSTRRSDGRAHGLDISAPRPVRNSGRHVKEVIHAGAPTRFSRTSPPVTSISIQKGNTDHFIPSGRRSQQWDARAGRPTPLPARLRELTPPCTRTRVSDGLDRSGGHATLNAWRAGCQPAHRARARSGRRVRGRHAPSCDKGGA